MIVPMKKVMLFIKQQEVDSALSALRKAGLVHIMTPKRSNESTHRISNLIQDYQRTISILTNEASQDNTGEAFDNETLEQQVSAILETYDTLPDYQERLRELSSLQKVYDQWGEVDPHEISALARKGIYLSLSRVENDRLPKNVDYIVLRREKRSSRVLFVTRDPDVQLPGEPVALPEMNLQEIQQEQQELTERIEHARSFIGDHGWLIPQLESEIKRLSGELEYEEVKSGLEAEHPVSWFMGFVPEEDIQAIREISHEHAWGIILDDPKKNEPVPTKLKNRPFVRLIEPIFAVLGTVPGYREFDISGLFLGFFAVFVAMIFGDAGYGMLFLLGSIILHGRAKRVSKTNGLLYLLSITTILWGAITGSWFGSETIASYGIFKAMTVESIAAFPEAVGIEAMVTQQNVMYICFILGTVQLSIACLMNLKRDFPCLSSLSHVGWFLLIIGLYYLVLNLVLGFDIHQWPYYLIGGGFSLIILFSAQKEGRSFFKGLAYGFGGLFTTFLDSVSTFSNIISYIRLFAVGMATVAISSNFNSMASPLFDGVMIPAALLILLIGHGLNIVMALLSVFVHGIRLNMLEFSGQLGMEWTGFSYAPFREHEETQDN